MKLWSKKLETNSSIQTFTGRHFYPFDPKVEDIDIEDIAHSLSLLCRFGGHCKEFYSVAQHCSIGAKYLMYSKSKLSVPTKHITAFQFLLHDATEAYLCDLPRPIKRNGKFGKIYISMESKIAGVIAEKFYLPKGFWLSDIIKEVDNRMLVTEKRDMLYTSAEAKKWEEDVYEPFPDKIIPLNPTEAKKEFFDIFHVVKPGIFFMTAGAV